MRMIFGRKENKIYSLGKAMKLAKDPNYQDWDFVPVDPGNIHAGYKMIPKEKMKAIISEVKNGRKRNEDFEKRITGEGKYKNVDQGVGQKYNQYQNAKRYQPEKFETR